MYLISKDIGLRSKTVCFNGFRKNLADPAAVNILEGHGVNFEQHKSHGIYAQKLFLQLGLSGLVKNNNIHFIAFQGTYDFGHIVKGLDLASGPGIKKLPKRRDNFLAALSTNFRNIAALKCMVGDHVSLTDLCASLGVQQEGRRYHAGPDSQLIMQCFAVMLRYRFHYNLQQLHNGVHGVGPYEAQTFQPASQ